MIPSPAIDDGGAPVVVVTGWTASGKTTLAERLAANGLARVTGSAALLPLLGDAGSSKAQRLLSWVSASAEPGHRSGDADRVADLAVLRMLAHRSSGCVVESCGSIALLMSPYNSALLIRLEAAAGIRAQRLRRLLGGAVNHDDALRIVRRKDATTADACLRSWGIDLTSQVHQRRYDLIVGCPDGAECADPNRCTAAVGDLAEAALGLYGRYLLADSRGMSAAVAHLVGVADRLGPWVRHIGGTLRDPVGPVTPVRWWDRLAHETDLSYVRGGGASC